MFDSLTDRLGGVFDRLRKRGSLSEHDVKAAMREIRVALLEADVALPVVKSFIDKVTTQAAGAPVLRSVSPGQQVVKIVYDQLVAILGNSANGQDWIRSSRSSAKCRTRLPGARSIGPRKVATMC